MSYQVVVPKPVQKTGENRGKTGDSARFLLFSRSSYSFWL